MHPHRDTSCVPRQDGQGQHCSRFRLTAEAQGARRRQPQQKQASAHSPGCRRTASGLRPTDRVQSTCTMPQATSSPTTLPPALDHRQDFPPKTGLGWGVSGVWTPGTSETRRSLKLSEPQVLLRKSEEAARIRGSRGVVSTLPSRSQLPSSTRDKMQMQEARSKENIPQKTLSPTTHSSAPSLRSQRSTSRKPWTWTAEELPPHSLTVTCIPRLVSSSMKQAQPPGRGTF